MALDAKLLIGGKLEDSDRWMDVIDPATARSFARVPRASIEQIERAIAAAKSAWAEWRAVPLPERRAGLLNLAASIEANADELAEIVVREQGKPLSAALGEVMGSIDIIRHFVGLDLSTEVLEDTETRHTELHYRSLGVVVGITPWNFPFILPLIKMAPALLMGNAFVLKPAATTPMSALALGALCSEAFPPGVVNVITDLNDEGERLTSHEDVAKIAFTGSTATGRRIMSSAAPTLKRLSMELGGNDFAIVLDDVDVEATANALFDVAFNNCGQVCHAVKRVFAHDAVYDALCDELAKRADATRVGSGMDQQTQLGPLQNRTQYERALDFLTVAREDGSIAAGGETIEPGYFLRPTIVRDIPAESRLVAEEQFAPILPLVRFDDVDTAIRQANDSVFGLGGSVWTGDAERAAAVAERIETGLVYINHHQHSGPHVPVAGAKQSGLGVEFTRAGLAEFAQLASVSVAKTPGASAD